MGPHQVGVVLGKPQDKGGEKEDEEQSNIDNMRYRSQEDEKCPSL